MNLSPAPIGKFVAFEAILSTVSLNGKAACCMRAPRDNTLGVEIE